MQTFEKGVQTLQFLLSSILRTGNVHSEHGMKCMACLNYIFSDDQAENQAEKKKLRKRDWAREKKKERERERERQRQTERKRFPQRKL